MYPSTPDTQRHDLTPADLLGMRVESGAGAAALNWYLGPWPATAPYPAEAAIPAANCVAAYQPHWGAGTIYARTDAATQANSYINLNTPGTYNASEVVGQVPGYSSAAGWQFRNNAYLLSGLTETSNTWSYLVEFAGFVRLAANNTYLFGAFTNSTTAVGISLGKAPAAVSDGRVAYHNAGYQPAVGYMEAGSNLSIAANKLYRDGSDSGGAIPAGTASPALNIAIGTVNAAGSYNQWRIWADMSTWAAYSITLTANQVANIAWAMGKISGRVP